MKASKIVAVFFAVALFFFGCANYNANFFPKHENSDSLQIFEWDKKFQTKLDSHILLAGLVEKAVKYPPEWEKLNAQQRNSALYLMEAIQDDFLKSVKKEEDNGTSFRDMDMDIQIGGTPDKNDLSILIIVCVLKPEEGKFTVIRYRKDWEICPLTNDPNLEEIVDQLVGQIIIDTKAPIKGFNI